MEDKPQQQCVIPLHKPSQKRISFLFCLGNPSQYSFCFFFEQLYPFSSCRFINSYFVAPFIEELAKVFPLFYRHGETERSLVTLGILIGLGFGISELVLYVYSGVPLIVRIPGVIFHASSAAITAYGIAKKNPLPYYLISVTASYDK